MRLLFIICSLAMLGGCATTELCLTKKNGAITDVAEGPC